MLTGSCPDLESRMTQVNQGCSQLKISMFPLHLIFFRILSEQKVLEEATSCLVVRGCFLQQVLVDEGVCVVLMLRRKLIVQEEDRSAGAKCRLVRLGEACQHSLKLSSIF